MLNIWYIVSSLTYSPSNIISASPTQSSMRLGKRSRNERKVTCMVGVMIAAFMVAWTPYSVFSLVKQFGDPASIGPGMAVLPSLIAKTSICYNPIIYVGMNSQVRHNLHVFRSFLNAAITYARSRSHVLYRAPPATLQPDTNSPQSRQHDFHYHITITYHPHRQHEHENRIPINSASMLYAS